jgi:transcription factor IIIB 90 kDa subunit
VCTDCGGTVIEYDQAAGNGFCVQCGTIVEENTIVNEVAFGEASNGAAIVQGSFVGQGASALVPFFHKAYSSIDSQVHQPTPG